MSILTFKNKKPKIQEKPFIEGELFFAFDIGTELLKGLLCRIKNDGIEVLKSTRIWQQHTAMRSGVIQNIDSVISNLKVAINDLTIDLSEDVKNSEYAPKKVILGIAGEMINGESVMVNFDREENATLEIDEEEETSIIGSVRENMIVNLIDDMATKYKLAPEDLIPLHVDLSSIEIGTVRTDRLVGFKGRTVKLFFNAVIAPYTLVEALVSVVKKMKLKVIAVVAQPFAVAKSLKNSKDMNFDGLFIDIGGGTTDIAIVENGNITDSYMFAFGGRIFTQRIAKEMNLDYRYAEQRKIKYSLATLDAHLQKGVRDAIKDDVSIWADGVRLALDEFQIEGNLPSDIYLCGGGSLLPDIKDIIYAYPWKQYLPFIQHPRPRVITPLDIGNVEDKTGKLNTPIDVTPIAIARYAWLIYTNPQNHLSIKI